MLATNKNAGAGTILAFFSLLAALAGVVSGEEKAVAAGSPATPQRLGFYLHACWTYDYPFAVRAWSRKDYDQMFQLLKRMGFNTVMLWPVVEAVPMPLSETDAKAVREFRPIIDDARRRGLECWLTYCPNVSCRPEIASKPWRDRSLYAFMQTVRLDDSAQAQAWLDHRSKLLKILNNADACVTIDGDPGGYAGAKPEDFLKVFEADHRSFKQSPTRPKEQKVVPWIWCGWGTKGVWQEPIEPFVAAELALLKEKLPEPAEFLIGQCRYPSGCYWKNVKAAEKLDLAARSTLMCYESVEFEPSAPAAKLQFSETRSTFQELKEFPGGYRGYFCNAQTPLMVLPNIYFFAQVARDASYASKSDEQVLRDFADFLGGPAELLVPAWSCLRLELKQIPNDLPQRLRAGRLKASTAQLIPGGPQRYLEILAAQVESRLKLLRAIEHPVNSPEAAGEALAKGIESLVEWWKLHHYVFDGIGHERFAWRFAEPSQVTALKQWAGRNVKGAGVKDLAVKRLVERGVLSQAEAESSAADLMPKGR